MRSFLVLAALAATAMIVAAAVTRGDELVRRTAKPAKPTKPTYGQLAREANRLFEDADALAAEGIFLESTGVGNDCVFVSLSNPTGPNVEYVQRRYARTCIEPRPMGPGDFCDGRPAEVVRSGSVRVPDVRDLGLAEASRRVLAAGLTFTTTCVGRHRNVEWVPVNPPDELVRVTSQCPRASRRVRRNTEVALLASATLPGGYEHHVGAASGC